MDIIFYLLCAWIIYIVFKSIMAGAFIYLFILLSMFLLLSLFIKGINLKLFLTILLGNLFYAGTVISNMKLNNLSLGSTH
jgi:hypothetical protein